MKASRVSAGGHNRGELSLMSCESGRPLAARILQRLNLIIAKDNPAFELELVQTEEVTFANGEIKTVINDNIRGADLYIVQAIDAPNSEKSINDNWIKEEGKPILDSEAIKDNPEDLKEYLKDNNLKILRDA